MLGTVEFSNGTTFPLQEIFDRVPSTAYMGSTHVNVAELLARGAFENDLQARQVYINAICRKSPRARAASALIALTRDGADQVARVESDFIDERFAPLLGPDVELVCHRRRSRNLLKRVEIVRFLGKAVCHRLLNFIGSLQRQANPESVVRAWVDTTDATFPREVEKFPLLIFPFTRRISRQLKYIQKCRRRKRKILFTGIPYRLRDMVKVALDWKGRDRNIIVAETRAFQRMADRLIRAGIRNIYTTDEFEVASCVLHGHLKQSGVQSINRSHGVSTYGPFVSYTVFRCHTQQQIEFYGDRGSVERFELKNWGTPQRERLQLLGEYDPVVVYLLGSWARAGKKYEAQLEATAVRELARAAQALGIPVIGKAHPNTTDAKIDELSRSLKVPVARTLPDISNQHPVFFTLLSSAYFDFLNRGPVYIFKDGLIRPEVLFGDQIETVDASSLHPTLSRFEDATYWQQAFQKQLAKYEPGSQDHSSVPENATIRMPGSQG